MLIKGDKVSVLDDAIDGVVIEVKGAEVTIETSDGFNLTFKSSELIIKKVGFLLLKLFQRLNNYRNTI